MGVEDSTETEVTDSITKHGAGINEELRAEIKIKNDNLLSFIVANNAEEVTKLSSDLLINNDPEGFNGVIELASDLIQTRAYTILSEYYSKTSAADIEISIQSETGNKKDTNDFTIQYTSPNKESYISLLLSDASHGVRMITVIYSKYASEWKVDYLHFSNYSLYGQTATEYYYASQEAHINDQLLEAFTLMLLSQSCYQPAGEIFDYKIQAELDEYNEGLTNEVRLTLNLPMLVDQISTQPKIYDIALVPIAGYQYIPRVTYISQLDITDEDAIHNECDDLNKALDQVLPGFSWQFNQVLYRVFDKTPEDDVEVQTLNILKDAQVIEQFN